MLSLESIKAEAEQAGRRAADNGLKPLSIREFSPDRFQEFCNRIPFLGDHIPEGWETINEVNDLFVDSSGHGRDNEPALSLEEFKDKLVNYKRSGDNYGFGISETGQSQLYIRVYRPDRRDFTHTGLLTEAELRLIRESK